MAFPIRELFAKELFDLLVKAIHASITIVTNLTIVKMPIPHTFTVPARHIIRALKITLALFLQPFLTPTNLPITKFPNGAFRVILAFASSILAHARTTVVGETLIVVDAPISWLFVDYLKLWILYTPVELMVAVEPLISWNRISHEV